MPPAPFNAIHRQTAHSSSPCPCFVTRRMLRCAMTFEPDHGASSAAAPSWWRRSWDRVRSARPGPPKTAAPAGGGRRLWRWGAWAVLAVVVPDYPLGALIVEDIDDDPQFAPRNLAPGESRAVATAAQLVTPEVDTHTWTPMMPFFTPAGILDNMPNFHRAIMPAPGRLSTDLLNHHGPTRGSTHTHHD